MSTNCIARQPAGTPTGGRFTATARQEPTSALETEPFRVWIQRSDGTVQAFGPYPDEAAAKLAMNDSLLIQGEVEEDCHECWYGNDVPGGDVGLIEIDPDEPGHMGDPANAEFWDSVGAVEAAEQARPTPTTEDDEQEIA